MASEATSLKRELATRGEAYLGRPEAGASAALPPTPHSVAGAPNAEPLNAEHLDAEPNGPAALTEIRMRDWPTESFKPARRRRARGLMIGAGAPSEIASAFDRLRPRSSIVLFALPPVLALDDAMAFSPFVDCALLVVEEGKTRVNDDRRALDCLRSTKILGVVLNRSRHAGTDARTMSR